MKCPHCLVTVHVSPLLVRLGDDPDGLWEVRVSSCPSCEKLVFKLRNSLWTSVNGAKIAGTLKNESLIRPKGSSRPPCPVEVPTTLTADYTEACLVISDSPKAAAALGRRCLQNLLHNHLKIKARNLSEEIQLLLDNCHLPSELQESVDAIRNIGNFAAHPLKSDQSGLILDVEPGEAEWTLDVLEELFDFYFVRPAITKAKRAALDLKLKEAGKQPMK